MRDDPASVKAHYPLCICTKGQRSALCVVHGGDPRDTSYDLSRLGQQRWRDLTVLDAIATLALGAVLAALPLRLWGII